MILTSRSRCFGRLSEVSGAGYLRGHDKVTFGNSRCCGAGDVTSFYMKRDSVGCYVENNGYDVAVSTIAEGLPNFSDRRRPNTSFERYVIVGADCHDLCKTYSTRRGEEVGSMVGADVKGRAIRFLITKPSFFVNEYLRTAADLLQQTGG